MFDFIGKALSVKRQQSLLRKPLTVVPLGPVHCQIGGAEMLNFAGNDYLGMAHHPSVITAWQRGVATWGAGSTASPLVNGHTQAHDDLCNRLATAFRRDKAMLFTSGFAANQAVIQAFAPKGTTVFMDKLSHASMIDGGLHAEGVFKRFAHNDLSHLQTLLSSSDSDYKLVATEGVFSMDGDSPDVGELIATCQQHNAALMLDDAHGIGVFGHRGLGTVEQQGDGSLLDQAQIPLLVGTFGKAIGTGGAFVVGDAETIEYLQNHARHYIYSTSIPPAQAEATAVSVELIMNDHPRRGRLHANIARFKQQCGDLGLSLLPSNSAIQPLLVGGADKVVSLQQSLADAGYWVGAIRAPTVPKGTERLRITISSEHTPEDIDNLCAHLGQGLSGTDLSNRGCARGQ